MSIRKIKSSLKLKQHLNRKSKDTGKKFFRYDLTISPDLVKALKWKTGDYLKAKTDGKRLIIEKE